MKFPRSLCSKPVHSAKTMVGIDVGIKQFATLSTGQVYEPVNSFKILLKKLGRAQRSLAQKIRGSNNFRKQKQKLAAIHIKVANVRSDYLHKVSTSISKNLATAVLEDLNIANMSKSATGTNEEPGKNVQSKSGLNRSILDQGWHTFKNLLQYKLDWLGGELIVVAEIHFPEVFKLWSYCQRKSSQPITICLCCVR